MTYPTQPQPGDPQTPPAHTGMPATQAMPQVGAPYPPGMPPPVQPIGPVQAKSSKTPLWIALAAVIGVLVGCGIGAAIGSVGSTTTKNTSATPTATVTVTATAHQASAASAATTAAPATTKAAAPATTKASAPKPSYLLNTSGKDIKNTAKFTTGDDWTIHYTYNCSGMFGGQGNFQVMIYTDGSLDTVAVNELGKKGSDSSPVYDDPGTHYLAVNSECSWTLKVTNG